MLRSRPARSAGRLLATAVAIALLGSLALLGGTACDDPGEPEIAPPGPPSFPTPPLTAEGLVAGIEIIYNDTVRTAAERLALYQNLFAPLDHDPGFKFYFVPDDVPPGEQPWWGIAEELQAHDNMFKAQEARNIDSLELSIQHLPAEDSVDHAGWKQVEATNVFLRLMFKKRRGAGGERSLAHRRGGARRRVDDLGCDQGSV